jgi:transcriptional regulator with XRE-family HTH domain
MMLAMNLKTARTSRGFTQLDLELASGIHQTKISILERGYRLPTDEERDRLARALGLESEVLDFHRREPPKPVNKR